MQIIRPWRQRFSFLSTFGATVLRHKREDYRMGPIDLAMTASGIFSGVGDSISSGADAGKNNSLDQMRTKEIVGGILVGAIGVVMSLREGRPWPLLVSILSIGLFVFLHEWNARKAAAANCQGDYGNVIAGPWK
jgi:hypothetical protein